MSNDPAETTERILLVDDDVVQATAMRSKLAKRGFDVTVVHSAEEAQDTVLDGDIACVLLDIMLPGISGIEMLTKIRKTFNRYHLPVIMITSRGEKTDIVGGLNAGANDYLVKPIDADIAAARVRSQLDLRRLSREQAQRQRLETITAMITTYNHEINNPLAIAVGNLAIYRKSHDEKKLDRIEKALGRIEQIVRQIQALEKNGAELADYVGGEKMFKVS